MQLPTFTRRGLAQRIAALAAALLYARQATAAEVTPRAAEGPFYPTPPMRLGDTDNDLVRVMGLVQQAGGEVIHLTGRVLDTDESPRPSLRVEIWQCDVNGTYLHPGDNRDVAHDTGFQGFGHDITGPDGSYRFRTIRPTIYPGRTPHIHVKVLDGDTELLTTQFYLADHPENARDGLFNRMTPEEQARVAMRFTEGADGPETRVDIVV